MDNSQPKKWSVKRVVVFPAEVGATIAPFVAVNILFFRCVEPLLRKHPAGFAIGVAELVLLSGASCVFGAKAGKQIEKRYGYVFDLPPLGDR